MRKFLFLAVLAAMVTACDNRELEEVCEISAAKDGTKDPNFLIFKDRTQSDREGTK